MDISKFSTEALKQELRLRQARLATSAEPKRSKQSDTDLPTVNIGGDEDSLFVPEGCSHRYKNDKAQSIQLSTRLQVGPFHSLAGGEGQRYSSSGSLHDLYGAAYAKEQALRRKDHGHADTQEGRDRKSVKRLQAEEDDLLILQGEQWKSTRLGTKQQRPINLDYGSFSSRHLQTTRRAAGYGRACKPISMPNPQEQQIFDEALARRLQNEENAAREERLRRAALRTRDCAVCSESTRIVDIPSLSSCTHNADVCSTCYSAWITSQLSFTAWQTVKCPATTCKVQLTYDEIKAYATEDIFEKHDAFQARTALGADPAFRWCRAAGCPSGQIHDEAELGNIFECVECATRICTTHGGPYHEGESCEDFEYRTSGQKERDERKKEDEASEAAVGELSKKCPGQGCGRPIEKNGGCAHMSCKSVRSPGGEREGADMYRLAVQISILLGVYGALGAEDLQTLVCGETGWWRLEKMIWCLVDDDDENMWV